MPLLSKLITALFLGVYFLFFSGLAYAEDSSSFYPTWKLLGSKEKEQFVAGYIQGWKDAAQVTDIAISFVQDNPGKAVEGLEQVKGLYDVRDIRPGLLAGAIDDFYSRPENQGAALSLAVSAAKSSLGG